MKETIVTENAEKNEPLVDLELNEEVAQEVEAGSSFSFSPTFRGGVYVASSD